MDVSIDLVSQHDEHDDVLIIWVTDCDYRILQRVYVSMVINDRNLVDIIVVKVALLLV